MYADLQNTAAEMLEEFGQSVTLTKPDYTGDNQEWNPVTGLWEVTDPEEDAVDPETESVNVVFVGIKSSWGELQGSRSYRFPIQEGDSIALVAGGGTLVPEQNDTLGAWTILAVEEVNPAGTVVLYKCHVRKQ